MRGENGKRWEIVWGAKNDAPLLIRTIPALRIHPYRSVWAYGIRRGLARGCCGPTRCWCLRSSMVSKSGKRLTGRKYSRSRCMCGCWASLSSSHCNSSSSRSPGVIRNHGRSPIACGARGVAVRGVARSVDVGRRCMRRFGERRSRAAWVRVLPGRGIRIGAKEAGTGATGWFLPPQTGTE